MHVPVIYSVNKYNLVDIDLFINCCAIRILIGPICVVIASKIKTQDPLTSPAVFLIYFGFS